MNVSPRMLSRHIVIVPVQRHTAIRLMGAQKVQKCLVVRCLSDICLTLRACSADLLSVQIMRACLCFLVVEFMRSGDSVGEACTKGVQRLLKLRPLHSFAPTSSTASAAAAGTCSGGITPGSGSTMHPTLVVGIVAMDKHGNVRALIKLRICATYGIVTRDKCIWQS